MSNKNFTHLDKEGNPSMVDVGNKKVTVRQAVARSIVHLDYEINQMLENGEIHIKKGPVFQTAIIAGVMGVKETSELIPLCHPLGLDKIGIDIKLNEKKGS